MASLVGQQLKDTYDSLLKTSDNDALGGTYKEITDGAGNGSNLYLGTGGRVGIGTSTLNTISGTNATLTLGGSGISGGLILQNAGTDKGRLYESGNLIIHQGMSSVGHSFYVNAGTEAMRIASTGDISFRDGSASEAFYWDASAGSLGIGTTSPDAPLSIDTGTTGTLAQFRGANTDLLNIDGDSDAIVLDARNVAYLGFEIQGSEKMRIDTDGNVGINNTSPSSFLPNGRELVLGNGSGSHGMTIFSDSAGTGNLFFADGTTGDEAFRGFLRYSHADDAMIIFTAGANERMRIDSSGNVGIGVTPSAWNSIYKVLQTDVGSIASSSSYNNIYVGANVFYDASNVGKYIRNDFATLYSQDDGIHSWLTAPSGTAGNTITFSEKARIDSDGLKFNGDTASANALDDYEEGTHQPTITCGTSGTITLDATRDLLSYTKIGRLMTVTGELQVSAVSSPTGNFQISLPTTIASLSEKAGRSVGSITITNTSVNIDSFVARGFEGNDYITVVKGGSTGGTDDSADTFSGNEFITLTFTYVSA